MTFGGAEDDWRRGQRNTPRLPSPWVPWAPSLNLPLRLFLPLAPDPFDPRRDITFDHYMYRWLNHRFMTGGGT